MNQSSTSLDRLIVGSNPLWGMDHYLAERARERNAYMTNQRVHRVLRAAFDSGASGFTFTADASVNDQLQEIRESGDHLSIGLYPLVPNMQTIPRLLAKGMSGMISEVLSDLSWSEKARTLIKGGWSVLRKDPFSALETYLDWEVSRLMDAAPQGSRLETVILHEIITDSMIALGADEAFSRYVRIISKRMGVRPGFETRNFVRFCEFSAGLGYRVSDFVVMAPFNSSGFQMTPTRDACERKLESLTGPHVVAVSILAGGMLPLESAVTYLKKHKQIESVAIGMSSEVHAKETFTRLSHDWLGRPA